MQGISGDNTAILLSITHIKKKQYTWYFGNMTFASLVYIQILHTNLFNFHDLISQILFII